MKELQGKLLKPLSRSELLHYQGKGNGLIDEYGLERIFLNCIGKAHVHSSGQWGPCRGHSSMQQYKVRKQRENNKINGPLGPVPRDNNNKRGVSDQYKCALMNVRSLVAHSQNIADLIYEHDCEIVCLTETWLNETSTPVLVTAVPKGYKIYTQFRHIGRGGGTAIIFKDHLLIKKRNEFKEKGCEILFLQFEFALNSFLRHPYYLHLSQK